MTPALSQAHTGLRGLLVGWIVLFHAVLYSAGWNLQGSALMPLFYLLAGYSLALTYGGRPLAPLRFWRNRLARIAPVYYVVMLTALPFALYGRSWVPPELAGQTLLTNLFAVQMWPGTPPLSFAGPAWTISTLVFFYLLFPAILAGMRRLGTSALRRWIWGLFWGQLVIYFGVSVALDPIDQSWAFWAAHAWPVSRLPVFAMAVAAGLLAMRGAPFGFADTAAVARKTDRNAAVFAVFILGFSGVSIAGHDLLASWWMQGVFVLVLLQVIAGLSLGASRLARLIRWPPLVWLGRIGLSLYLIHEVVIYAVAWATAPEAPFFFAVMPGWSVLVVLPLSLGLAAGLERFVERPARAWLRAPRG